jgi:hypothetical protein
MILLELVESLGGGDGPYSPARATDEFAWKVPSRTTTGTKPKSFPRLLFVESVLPVVFETLFTVHFRWFCGSLATINTPSRFSQLSISLG